MTRVAHDGATEREHQESAAAQWAKLGKKPKAADTPDPSPPLPDQIAYLWFWFLEILGGLDSGGMGVATVSWSNLKAWVDLTGNELEPWEISAVIRMGTLRASIISEDITKKAKKK